MIVQIIPPATYQEDSPEGVDPPYQAGDEIPIDQRFTPEFVAMLADITDVDPQPLVGYRAVEVDGVWQFTPPPPTS